MAITATPEPANSPPRTRLNLTGFAPSTDVTISRRDPDGRTAAVRGAEPVRVSATGTAVVYDYEAPYGLPVQYLAAALGQASATVTLNAAASWLIHPGVPSRSVLLGLTRAEGIKVLDGSARTRTQSTTRTVLQPLGRTRGIAVSFGRRLAGSSSLTLRTYTAASRLALSEVLADDVPLLLNPVPQLEALTRAYISIGDVDQTREDAQGGPWWTWTLPYDEVDRPDGNFRATWTWGDVALTYATWADVRAAYDTWGDLLTDSRAV